MGVTWYAGCHFLEGRAENTNTERTVGVVTPQTLSLTLPPEGFKLEKGGALPEIKVTYERCGAVTPENDNVIFVCHALTGDAHVAGIRPGETEPDGWWEGMIGPGNGIDTDRYQVICANILGGCKGTTGPSSLNPADGRPYGAAFPKRFSIGGRRHSRVCRSKMPYGNDVRGASI